jgi:hypothetical protein
VLLEHMLNKPLLEFGYRIGIRNSVINHSVDEGQKLVFHGSAPVGEEILKLRGYARFDPSVDGLTVPSESRGTASPLLRSLLIAFDKRLF